MKRILITLTILLNFIFKLSAQISIQGGANFSNIRDNGYLENNEPALGFQLGTSFQYYPIKTLPKFSIQNGILINNKGYQQELDKKYDFNFSYLSFPVVVNYDIVENITINMGTEISYLFYTNVEEGTKTYNNFDLGIVLGISIFNNKRISIYSCGTYGVMPMLDYYTIDKHGNFTGEIHDLKNICTSIGIKLNLHNEKIYLFK
jgi:hypothetical protein